jgi:hypothetical protein
VKDLGVNGMDACVYLDDGWICALWQ